MSWEVRIILKISKCRSICRIKRADTLRLWITRRRLILCYQYTFVFKVRTVVYRKYRQGFSVWTDDDLYLFFLLIHNLISITNCLTLVFKLLHKRKETKWKSEWRFHRRLHCSQWIDAKVLYCTLRTTCFSIFSPCRKGSN